VSEQRGYLEFVNEEVLFLRVRCVRVGMSVARGHFGNPEEGERPPLEAIPRRLVKTVTEATSQCVIVIYKV
jgi:hypothetical protein